MVGVTPTPAPSVKNGFPATVAPRGIVTGGTRGVVAATSSVVVQSIPNDITPASVGAWLVVPGRSVGNTVANLRASKRRPQVPLAGSFGGIPKVNGPTTPSPAGSSTTIRSAFAA